MAELLTDIEVEMAIFGLKIKLQNIAVSENLERFVNNFSIEVMPRTQKKLKILEITCLKIRGFILLISREHQLKTW